MQLGMFYKETTMLHIDLISPCGTPVFGYTIDVLIQLLQFARILVDDFILEIIYALPMADKFVNLPTIFTSIKKSKFVHACMCVTG
jgi:hypothetical protein